MLVGWNSTIEPPHRTWTCCRCETVIHNLDPAYGYLRCGRYVWITGLERSIEYRIACSWLEKLDFSRTNEGNARM